MFTKTLTNIHAHPESLYIGYLAVLTGVAIGMLISAPTDGSF